MNKPQPEPAFQPGIHYQKLLRAALLSGTPAREAWLEWIRNTDINELDPASRNLTPLLHRNLRAMGIEHPSLAKFKGIQRFTWCENQIKFKELEKTLRLFRGAGIPTLVLKGAALSLMYYRDAGLRPMNDVDILVPFDQTDSAIALLQKSGRAPQPMVFFRFNARYRAMRHAHSFKDDKGQALDLHWRLLRNSLEPDADDDFWNESVPLSVGSEETRALGHTDQFLHTCLHGMSWNPAPPWRWMADAVTILRSEQEVDWNRLVEQAEKRRLIIFLREALSCLVRVLEAPVPKHVLDSLDETPVSRWERLEYRADTCPDHQRGPSLALAGHFSVVRRSRIGQSSLRQILGLIPYFLERWRLDSVFQLPPLLLKKYRSRRQQRKPAVN